MVAEPPLVAFAPDACPRQAYLNMSARGKSSRPSPEHGESLKDLVNRALAGDLGARR